MISADALLQPVSAEKPCGDDISYDATFMELDSLLQGKPETQFSAAEPPDWRKIRNRCQELWQRSKHLRIATTMMAAEVQVDGFPAFKEGLALLNGLVRNHWADLYPRLDEADGNDPTERVNIVTSIAAPLGTFGDPLKIAQRLRDIPLTTSAQAGRFSASDILRSQSGKAGPDEQPPPSEAQIRAAFDDTPKETRDALAQALTEASELVGSLDEALTSAVGVGNAASLAGLKKELDSIRQQVAAYSSTGDGDGAPAAEATEEGAAPGKGESGTFTMSGNISSRRQAIQMIEKVRQYYAQHEPSSPVPFVLQHAQRLAEMDFLQIIGDLAQDVTKDVQKMIGVRETEQPPNQGG